MVLETFHVKNVPADKLFSSTTLWSRGYFGLVLNLKIHGPALSYGVIRSTRISTCTIKDEIKSRSTKNVTNVISHSMKAL